MKYIKAALTVNITLLCSIEFIWYARSCDLLSIKIQKQFSRWSGLAIGVQPNADLRGQHVHGEAFSSALKNTLIFTLCLCRLIKLWVWKKSKLGGHNHKYKSADGWLIKYTPWRKTINHHHHHTDSRRPLCPDPNFDARWDLICSSIYLIYLVQSSYE